MVNSPSKAAQSPAPASPSKPAPPSPTKQPEKRKADEPHADATPAKKVKEEPGFSSFFLEKIVEVSKKNAKTDDATKEKLVIAEWEKLTPAKKAEWAAKAEGEDEEEEEDYAEVEEEEEEEEDVPEDDDEDED